MVHRLRFAHFTVSEIVADCSSVPETAVMVTVEVPGCNLPRRLPLHPEINPSPATAAESTTSRRKLRRHFHPKRPKSAANASPGREPLDPLRSAAASSAFVVNVSCVLTGPLVGATVDGL